MHAIAMTGQYMVRPPSLIVSTNQMICRHHLAVTLHDKNNIPGEQRPASRMIAKWSRFVVEKADMMATSI